MARQQGTPLERVRAQCVWVGTCRIWVGPRDRYGHGKISVGGRTWAVHRLVWSEQLGPIPAKHDLHHLCQNKCCTTLAHLQLLSHAEHTRRHNLERDTCKRGHPFDGTRTARDGTVVRTCGTCARARRDARRAA